MECILPDFLTRTDALELIEAAARGADAAYGAPDAAERSVNLYWWRNPTSAKITRSVLADGTTRHCVAFRGTIMTEAGNWVFANMQAFKTKFEGYPVEGEVHMGFYRAFHWLWSPLDREPKIDEKHKIRRRKVAALRGGVIIVILACVWAALVSLNHPWGAPLTKRDQILALKFLVGFVLLLFVEFGWAEKGFTLRKPRPHGIPLETTLRNVSEQDEVVFTGHSLGGAMAVHAFLLFRKLKPAVKSSLITFGAPRAGDEEWIKSVVKFTGGRDQHHIVNNGDPVPQVPGTFAQARRLKSGAGSLKALFILLGLGREVWALLYNQTAPGDWPSKLIYPVGTYPLRFMKHPMAVYGDELQANLDITVSMEKRSGSLLAVVGFATATLLSIALVLGLLWGLVFL
ncbi:MAG: hypothetical protein ABIS50_01155 [Luteolibacter sp.]|uniref:lipase family protein n=1 Tax=Luteolibacter sp. TaxID=1962973 RepID=UPI0032672FE8